MHAHRWNCCFSHAACTTSPHCCWQDCTSLWSSNCFLSPCPRCHRQPARGGPTWNQQKMFWLFALPLLTSWVQAGETPAGLEVQVAQKGLDYGAYLESPVSLDLPGLPSLAAASALSTAGFGSFLGTDLSWASCFKPEPDATQSLVCDAKQISLRDP